MMNFLEKSREKIDGIDNKIITLIKKRSNLSIRLASYKKKNNLKIRDIKREKEILKGVEKKSVSLNKKYINEIFKLIIKISLESQRKEWKKKQ